MPYVGDCITATVYGGLTIIGGTVHFHVQKTGILVPDSANPCSFWTGSYYGDKIDL